jgi:hypothetical protein
MIDMASQVVRVPNIPSASLGDEVAMLDAARGKYVVVNEMGAFIWARLERPMQVSDLCADIERAFDVSPAQCAAEVLAFLQRLEARQLLTVVTEAGA